MIQDTRVMGPNTYKVIGDLDLLFLCGGGILGHPGGIKAGVESVKQAWEAAVKGIDLNEFAQHHIELKQAIEFYG